MATGNDQLLCVVGMIFLMRRPRDVASVLAIRRRITLTSGALAGLRVDPYAIDAVIGLFVSCKALENLALLRLLHLRTTALGFGSAHRLDLSGETQDILLSPGGPTVSHQSFNVGVEIERSIASAGLVALFGAARRHAAFPRIVLDADVALFGAATQIARVLMTRRRSKNVADA
ncbi:MAG: HupE/UreJ family protein [Pseudomonadota bacterium]